MGGMKYLIVTADDLGLARSVNDGIVQACREGIVTAVSVIPTGEAFPDALKKIKELPFKDTGAHLSLSETKPIRPTTKFCKDHNEFFLNFLLGRMTLNNIYLELKAQMEVLRKSGLKITHINSHGHIHMLPRILSIFIRIAKDYNVQAIRFPRLDRPVGRMAIREKYRKTALDHFTPELKRVLRNSPLKYTDNFFGLLDAGRLNIDRIKGILKMSGPGVTELVTHPGFLGPEVLERYPWHIGGETELFALTDKRIKNAVAANGIKLITYEEFIALRK